MIAEANFWFSPNTIPVSYTHLNLRIPDNFDFTKVNSLSMECRIKLNRYRPRTIAQASRISGVSPADIQVLLIYFGR